ncbi:hypothetical Protein YC6258_02232 [Gynuella sunshinyii YC6258]|uniref:Uncharacterized protein n=1 Tax=Gynuella sunshinyii YC6258 TaxID=1445510 RepID=A0A0C5V487_9GAMM|nr:hypothetical Protein YC6258_02232 [Gynuella sunshinyii YC6258]
MIFRKSNRTLKTGIVFHAEEIFSFTEQNYFICARMRLMTSR